MYSRIIGAPTIHRNYSVLLLMMEVLWLSRLSLAGEEVVFPSDSYIEVFPSTQKTRHIEGNRKIPEKRNYVREVEFDLYSWCDFCRRSYLW